MKRAELSLGLFASLCVGCSQRAVLLRAPSPEHGRAVTLLVLGDSLALGTGATSPSEGWAFEVYKRIRVRRPGSVIRNFAIGGATVADVLRMQASRLRHVAPDVVILEVGGNDVVRRTASAVFARAYLELLHEVRRVHPHAPIIAVGVPDVSISPIFRGLGAAALRSLAKADDTAARAAAAATRSSYVDLFAVSDRLRSDTSRYLATDQFHPSSAGHSLIAARVTPVLERLLDERDRTRAR